MIKNVKAVNEITISTNDYPEVWIISTVLETTTIMAFLKLADEDAYRKYSFYYFTL